MKTQLMFLGGALAASLVNAMTCGLGLGVLQEKPAQREPSPQSGRVRELEAWYQAGKPLDLKTVHARAIEEKTSWQLDEKALALERDVVGVLYGVMDSFIQKDLEALSRYIHPRMIEFDSMSPYREVGKASFLEHMIRFFGSPEHIEDHFLRIKEPLVQGYGDNVAVVSFHYDTEASVGGQFMQNYGKASFVFVKDDRLGEGFAQQWLLAVCHYSTLRPSLR